MFLSEPIGSFGTMLPAGHAGISLWTGVCRSSVHVREESENDDPCLSRIRHRNSEPEYLASALELEVGTAGARYPATATQNRRREALPNTEHEPPQGRDRTMA